MSSAGDSARARCGGQFDGEGDPVQPASTARRRRAPSRRRRRGRGWHRSPAAGTARRRAPPGRRRGRHLSGTQQRRHLVDALGGETQRHGWRSGRSIGQPEQPLGEGGGRVEHVLAVVQHEEQAPFGAPRGGRRSTRGPTGSAAGPGGRAGWRSRPRHLPRPAPVPARPGSPPWSRRSPPPPVGPAGSCRCRCSKQGHQSLVCAQCEDPCHVAARPMSSTAPGFAFGLARRRHARLCCCRRIGGDPSFQRVRTPRRGRGHVLPAAGIGTRSRSGARRPVDPRGAAPRSACATAARARGVPRSKPPPHR